MLLLYLAVLITAIYWVIKTLGPEMAPPSAPISIKFVIPAKAGIQTRGVIASEAKQSDGPDDRIEKLETLLVEKNKKIAFLQTELKIFYTQAGEFDKIKALLEEEVHRLREQNRIFRSELGLPAAQPKENSIT